ncbi:hypothetical protein IQE94_11015 [Synechocystis sp. PCC 7339]|uniref:hypothetical protein n=1 Tax=unclassified Synechocystis TaxID=2640012 RepID=UPI001BAF408D|nr:MULTISPECIES: hypothetical protein [unclassified Synechocystis]QUS59484.1 hypothetical protein HTZ78_01510 [Synechocystis sp. PCC 7338]UAJ71669.1 hypothetical protein IQE94_11015 [Synechocystis sp. PCC 7339]
MMAPIGFSQYIRVFGITGNDFARLSGLEGFQELFSVLAPQNCQYLLADKPPFFVNLLSWLSPPVLSY